MFTFTIDQKHQVLMIAVQAELTDETLAAFDQALKAHLEQHGPMDVIVDFTEVVRPTLITPQLVKSRAGLPSRVPGRHRIFVAPDDYVFGMLRMYSAHRGDPPIIVVRTMNDALKQLGRE